MIPRRQYTIRGGTRAHRVRIQVANRALTRSSTRTATTRSLHKEWFGRLCSPARRVRFEDGRERLHAHYTGHCVVYVGNASFEPDEYARHMEAWTTRPLAGFGRCHVEGVIVWGRDEGSTTWQAYRFAVSNGTPVVHSVVPFMALSSTEVEFLSAKGMFTVFDVRKGSFVAARRG